MPPWVVLHSIRIEKQWVLCSIGVHLFPEQYTQTTQSVQQSQISWSVVEKGVWQKNSGFCTRIWFYRHGFVRSLTLPQNNIETNLGLIFILKPVWFAFEDEFSWVELESFDTSKPLSGCFRWIVLTSVLPFTSQIESTILFPINVFLLVSHICPFLPPKILAALTGGDFHYNYILEHNFKCSPPQAQFFWDFPEGSYKFTFKFCNFIVIFWVKKWIYMSFFLRHVSAKVYMS